MPALPRELLQEIMLRLPFELILELGFVDRCHHSCLEQNRFWLSLLSRDYSDCCYQEQQLHQYRAQARAILAQDTHHGKIVIKPPGPYCPRQIYLTLFYFTLRRDGWKEQLLVDVDCPGGCISVVDLYSPLVITQHETKPLHKEKILYPSFIFITAHVPNTIDKYAVWPPWVGRDRDLIYPPPSRTCPQADRLITTRAELLELFQQLAQSGFLVSASPRVVPPALLANNQYLLNYSS